MAFDGTIQDFPEAKKSRAELLQRARELKWYHTLKLDESLTTPGEFALDPYVPFYLPPFNLAQADCLEIGAGNGYWSYQLEKLGARSVTALDIADFVDTDFSIRFGKESERPTVRSPEGTFGEGLRIAATLLQSRLRYKLCSVYDLRPETAGSYDLVFCGSMLMHLFGPMIALQRMAAVCRDAFLITTETDLSLEGLAALSYRGHEIPYVHFVPSPTCLQHMLTSCGYERVLRGPTFFLEFRDKSNPMKIPHTSFIGLKSVARSGLGLPPPADITGTAARAAIELARPISTVFPGQPFDVLVKVRNESNTLWHQPTANRRLTVEARAGDGDRVRVPVADYLPAGTDSLVNLKLMAPMQEGPLAIDLRLSQGGTDIPVAAPRVEISVTRGAGSVVDSVVSRVRRLLSN